MVKHLYHFKRKKQEKDVGTKPTRLKLIETRNISTNNLSQCIISLKHRIAFISRIYGNRICLQLETARFDRACGSSLDKHEKATWQSKETTAESI